MDTRFYKDINGFASSTAWLHGAMRLCATYGLGLFAVMVLAVWWLARSSVQAPRAVAASVWAALASASAIGLNQPLATTVGRPRPFAVLAHAEVLVGRSHDFSFPSDHAVAAGAAAAALWVIARYSSPVTKRVALAGTLVALLVAFSRVYVGVHYPGDSVAGLAFGAAVCLVGWAILGQALTASAQRAAHLPRLRPLITNSKAVTERM